MAGCGISSMRRSGSCASRCASASGCSRTRRISSSRSSCASRSIAVRGASRWQIGVGLALYDLLSVGQVVAEQAAVRARRAARRRCRGSIPTGSSAGRATTTRRCGIRSGSSSRTCAMPSTTEPCSRRTRASRAFESSAAARPESTGNRRSGSGGARAPLIVNAAGPWVDEVLGPIQHTRLIGGTKGSHIVVPPFPARRASASTSKQAPITGRSSSCRGTSCS